jgi:tripartite motif-containing protein 2/3
MMNSSSTLVATVSINYEDFTEGFLTCGTCLCAYDQAEHAPKLLSCSHTICQSCLELIASSPTLSNTTEPGCIKCPICRQNIAIPSGGISALPPSFLVNQLFDLVNKKPREFIPKCSVHLDQELLFCETCDCVFCDTCNNSSESDDSLTTSSLITTTTTSTNPSANSTARQQQYSKQHINETCTVIPFSTAIKRMSEILNYRSQQCLGRLDEAKENVQKEIEKLEANRSDAVQDIESSFERIRKIIEDREKELLEEINKLRDHKKNVLLQQLDEIEAQKSSLSVKSNVKVNNETDVKNLSKKISDLTEKNDTALALFTPRENCLICFEDENDEAMNNIRESVNHYGKVRTSKTYPPYCTSELLHYSTHLRSVVIVQSVDYEGSQQKVGGDPIQAELKLVGYNDDIDGDIVITDRRDGTYEVSFIPPWPGKYQLYIYLFNRPIKNCPLTFETNSHHNPVAIFGQSSKRGTPDQFDHFSQPASLIINKHDGRIYVMDSFNSRIKVLAQIDSVECPFSFMQHIQSEFFSRSCTGIALLYPEDDDHMQKLSLSPNKPPNPNILVTDWRNHTVYELNGDGKLLRQYNHEDMQEPTNIVVDSRGRIFVVDREVIFVFNSTGKLLNKLMGYKYKSGLNNKERDVAPVKDETFGEIDKRPTATQMKQASQATANLMSTVRSNNESNKENKSLSGTATLSNYLINNNSLNTKQAKSGTLSSLISIRRKPVKINPGSSLQRGSKAVISAATRIRSTFTLSHSTSLVSAASLQSVFNNSSKQQQINSNNQNTISLHDENQDSNRNGSATIIKQKNSENKLEQYPNNGMLTSLTPPLSEHEENEAPECDTVDKSRRTEAAAHEEPFGVIRGIAIGPDDELIVADESCVKVLQLSGDEYLFKRELFKQSRLGGHNAGPMNSGRLCSLTYDSQSKQLLALYTSLSSGGTPFIQVVDYPSGKAKFIIDSHDSKLMRPSCLATFGQHVIVTDLGDDCIKKYRIY